MQWLAPANSSGLDGIKVKSSIASSLPNAGMVVSKLHWELCLLLWSADSGWPLLSWTSDNAVLLSNETAKPKPMFSMLPLLIVLFLISYGLMSMLVIEQARTIQSQSSLIRSLFDDSSQLTQLKNKALHKQHAEAQAQAEAKAHSQKQTPSTQDKPRDHAKNGSKLHRPFPQKPPKDAAATADERRTVVRI